MLRTKPHHTDIYLDKYQDERCCNTCIENIRAADPDIYYWILGSLAKSVPAALFEPEAQWMNHSST